MGEIIYWNKFRKPKVVYDPILKLNREVNGQYVCKDERVESFWLVGYVKSDNTMGMRGELLLKNNQRKSFEASEIHNKVDEDLVSQAEEYLKTF